MAKKPVEKSEDSLTQKIQFAALGYVPSRTKADDEQELYRRIVEEAQARGASPDLTPLFRSKDTDVWAPVGRALRRLLTDIVGFAELLEKADTEQDRKRRGEYLEIINSSASKMLAMIDVLAERGTASTAAERVLRDVCGIGGRLPDGYVPPSKKLPKSDDDVVKYASTDIMPKDDFIREFTEVAQYLNAEQKAKALERARYEGRIGRFLAEINASENKPTLKRFAPVWWSLPEFLEKEWYAKGWIRPDVDRQMVEAYDTGLPGLITKWEDTNGLLPGHLRFAKVLNRSSKAERASKKPNITKS